MIYKNDLTLTTKIKKAMKAIKLNIRVANEDGNWVNVPEITESNYKDGNTKNTMARTYDAEALAKSITLASKAYGDKEYDNTGDPLEAEILTNLKQTTFEGTVDHSFQDDYDKINGNTGMEAIVQVIAKEVIDYIIEYAEISLKPRFNSLDEDFNELLDTMIKYRDNYEDHKTDVIERDKVDDFETIVSDGASSDINKLPWIPDPLVPGTVLPSPASERQTKINEIIDVLNAMQAPVVKSSLDAAVLAVNQLADEIDAEHNDNYSLNALAFNDMPRDSSNGFENLRKSASTTKINQYEKVINTDGISEEVDIK